ncbi:CheR family methyltransferase [Magnetococcales bacterium HHB-1]
METRNTESTRHADPFPKRVLEPLVEAVQAQYGYDFRHYNISSLGRRIKWTMSQSNIDSLQQFQLRILEDPSLLRLLIRNLSINVTTMFRDPLAFLYLRENVLPVLATYPYIRIWCAGIATGEEAYTMAILLQEENLYHRALIYATDFNPAVVQHAINGRFDLERIADYTRNYIQSGGKTAFSKYYQTTTGFAHMSPELRKNIIFSTHNLVTDGIFNEFHLILCRNVLIYFNEQLTEQVISLFRESLAMRCFLFLGKKEQLQRRGVGQFFESVGSNTNIYCKL